MAALVKNANVNAVQRLAQREHGSGISVMPLLYATVSSLILYVHYFSCSMLSLQYVATSSFCIELHVISQKKIRRDIVNS